MNDTARKLANPAVKQNIEKVYRQLHLFASENRLPFLYDETFGLFERELKRPMFQTSWRMERQRQHLDRLSNKLQKLGGDYELNGIYLGAMTDLAFLSGEQISNLGLDRTVLRGSETLRQFTRNFLSGERGESNDLQLG